MDLSFLYGWDGYYFLQGFWLDIKLLIANANPLAVIICFAILLAILLFIERKRFRFAVVLFTIAAAIYGTFLLTLTILGRSPGNISSWDQLLVTYERAFFGEGGAQLDIFYNIVLYIPVGLLISHYKNTKLDIIILAAIPLAIEIAQLITTRGVFELTDILNNFIGGMIGFGFARLIAMLVRLIKSKRKGGQGEREKRTHRSHRITTE